MCEIGTMLAIGSAVVGGIGQIQQGQAQAAAARYQAQVGEMNAQLADRRARDALERGQLEEQKKRQEAAAIRSRQVAAMSANGVDTSFGSPLETLIDTATMGELDALTIRTNANRESYDFKVDAVNKRAGAELARANARSAEAGGYLSALGTVLGGASNAYSKYKLSQGVSRGGTGTSLLY